MDDIINKLFQLADESLKLDEFPVSAIIYDDDDKNIISYGYNKRNKSKKTTDHAEIIAIEYANKKLNSWNLSNKCMIVTLEPCEMCQAVIREARLKKVEFIVPRYAFKNQYKRTTIFQSTYSGNLKDNYIKSITTFFNDKR